MINRSPYIDFSRYNGEEGATRKPPAITTERINAELCNLRTAQRANYAWHRHKRIIQLEIRLEKITTPKE